MVLWVYRLVTGKAPTRGHMLAGWVPIPHEQLTLGFEARGYELILNFIAPGKEIMVQ